MSLCSIILIVYLCKSVWVTWFWKQIDVTGEGRDICFQNNYFSPINADSNTIIEVKHKLFAGEGILFFEIYILFQLTQNQIPLLKWNINCLQGRDIVFPNIYFVPTNAESNTIIEVKHKLFAERT